jgi:hypothetical protein
MDLHVLVDAFGVSHSKIFQKVFIEISSCPNISECDTSKIESFLIDLTAVYDTACYN